MENIALYIVIAILAVVVVGYLAYKIIKIFGLPEEEKKKVLISYLIPLVTMAEEFIGSGHGAEKLNLVEDWFAEKAPIAYKLMLKAIGKENLKELIEEALRELKENFAK